MSVKAMDEVYSRWLLDSRFRNLLDDRPEFALAGYDLTDKEREKLSAMLQRRKCSRQKKQEALSTKLERGNRSRPANQEGGYPKSDFPPTPSYYVN